VSAASDFWWLVALLGVVVLAVIANAACTTSVEIGPAGPERADEDDE
jgi:hypothetical protein